MGKFSVNPSALKSHSTVYGSASQSLMTYSNQVREVGDNLDSSFDELKAPIFSITARISGHANTSEKFGNTLINIANIYEEGENNILGSLKGNNAAAADPGTGGGAAAQQPNPPAHDGETRTGLPEDEGFVRVIDENGDVSYGGDQYWFPQNADIDTYNFGCGVIASVNYYLYLAGIKEISKADYMKLCEEFYNDGILRKTAVNEWGGAIPPQMEDFIYKKLNENGVHNVMPYWDYTEGYESDYNYMKQELNNGRPIIWAVHDNEGESLGFYNYDPTSNSYVPSGSTASSHYITVTGIYESTDANGNQVRWVEVSNCGKQQYVSWDEYLQFVDASSTKDKIYNRIGSSVMRVH